MSYKSDEIKRRRIEAAEIFMRLSSNVRDEELQFFDANDLELLFGIYDDVFFEHWFAENFRGKIKFSVSSRLNNCAGKTFCPRNISRMRPEEVEIEVRMGVHFFLRFHDVPGVKEASGIVCDTPLEALQLVWEHELCHVIEFLTFGDSACGRRRFKDIAKGIFGHTDSHHRLPTGTALLSEATGLQLGSQVAFLEHERENQGLLYRLGSKATVLVKDSRGRFIGRDGQRYSKRVLPLSALRKL